MSWQNLEIKLDENNKLILTDLEQCTSTEIDFRDKLVDMKVGYGYLIVVTSSQCHIYPLQVSKINSNIKNNFFRILMHHSNSI